MSTQLEDLIEVQHIGGCDPFVAHGPGLRWLLKRETEAMARRDGAAYLDRYYRRTDDGRWEPK